MVQKKEEQEQQLGWYEKFKLELQELGIKSVQPIIELIDETEGKETQEKIDEIKSLVKKLELTPEEEVKIFEKFRHKSKKFHSSAESLKFIKNKFQRKHRLLQNRIQRAIPEGFGSYIRHLRESRGYSLKDVERITGISPSYVNRIEKGERKAPSFPIIEKLAEAYKVEVSEILKVAGINEETVQGLAQILFTSNFTINGKMVSKRQKEILVELITKLDEVKWNEKTKHIDTVELIRIIDEYKKASSSQK